MLTSETLEDTLADAVMDRPREFFIDGERFCLWSPSLGMSVMTGRHIGELGVDAAMMAASPAVEALRLVSAKRDEVCRVLAILSFRTFDELCDSRLICSRAEHFAAGMSDEEIAQLLLVALSQPRVEALSELSGIRADRQEQARIAAHKNRDGHTVSFGGKTLYGSLIDAACRAYGWRKDYVVWGIDLLSLRLMLADTVSSVYLSDDDMKALGRHSTSGQVFGMSPADISRLKSMDWE